jgi:hypothetical protein
MSAVPLNAEEFLERVVRNGAMNNGRCRMHGGKSTGSPKGNSNAEKHGRMQYAHGQDKQKSWRQGLGATRIQGQYDHNHSVKLEFRRRGWICSASLPFSTSSPTGIVHCVVFGFLVAFGGLGGSGVDTVPLESCDTR